MATEDDTERSNAWQTRNARDAGSQGTAAREWDVPSFEDVLKTLPPEERELVILAASGC